jgi:exosortase
VFRENAIRVTRRRAAEASGSPQGSAVVGWRAMRSHWNKLRATVPASFLATLALAVGFLGLVAWDQSHWWRAKEDYVFGWLVPVFAAFVVHERWPAIVQVLGACAAPGSPRVSGWRAALVAMTAWTLMAGGVALFLLGAFYRAGAGASQPGTAAITYGACAILWSLIFLAAPESSAPQTGAANIVADARVRLAALFLFPLAVWIISAPIVSVVENQLRLTLLRKVVTVVAFTFDVLGLPIEQQGNVLALPTGTVGVEDACSGIRSLTGCLFVGSFLAAIYVESLWRKIALLVAALALAFVTNLARSLFLTAWAYNYGPRAIEGTVHDVAGYAVLGLTLLGLMALLPLLKVPLKHEETPAAGAAT